MPKGKFVVLDGLDGSGKKTQVDLLVEYCEENGIKTATVDFPQYYKTFFGDLVGRYLKGEFGSLEETNPYLAALTFAGDRWQAKEKMEQALENRELLLANRYVSSSMAFMAAKLPQSERQEFVQWLQELEYQVFGIPKEDFLIYLSVSPEIGRSLVLKKGKRKYMDNQNSHDIHEQDLTYMQKVKMIYLRFVEQNSNWVKIDCLDQQGKMRSKKQIHQQIVQILQERELV